MLRRQPDVLLKSNRDVLENAQQDVMQHLHWTCSMDTHLIMKAKAKIIKGILQVALRHFLERLEIIPVHQLLNLGLGFSRTFVAKDPAALARG